METAVHAAERPNVVQVHAPASGELLAELPVTSPDEVRRTVSRARAKRSRPGRCSRPSSGRSA